MSLSSRPRCLTAVTACLQPMAIATSSGGHRKLISGANLANRTATAGLTGPVGREGHGADHSFREETLEAKYAAACLPPALAGTEMLKCRSSKQKVAAANSDRNPCRSGKGTQGRCPPSAPSVARLGLSQDGAGIPTALLVRPCRFNATVVLRTANAPFPTNFACLCSDGNARGDPGLRRQIFDGSDGANHHGSSRRSHDPQPSGDAAGRPLPLLHCRLERIPCSLENGSWGGFGRPAVEGRLGSILHRELD